MRRSKVEEGEGGEECKGRSDRGRGRPYSREME